ncbi:hypothetical protein [Streptantibioticus ferralitis]|uniref:Uncharacterized protein n=1 Tax=Streptantibioticus ferralitis TaxID=236510 RepID=A0ABT5YTW3_9ACTN|nr:hypothetical protein [Streptantibioticus ferralitis]MDF2254822.1 hypothetical protein [Streptantibioticus ferralitis]
MEDGTRCMMSVPEAAAAHADALEVRIRTLRLRRALLRAVAERSRLSTAGVLPVQPLPQFLDIGEEPGLPPTVGPGRGHVRG